MIRSAALALTAVLVLPWLAQAAPVTPVLLFERSLPGVQTLAFGYVAGGEDVDGDGHPDILFGTANGTYGLVTLYSGGDAHEIASIPGAQSVSFLGSSVAFVGDLDGDGVSEFVAAAAGEAHAFVYSGATQTRLFPRKTFPYGGTVVPLGDVDADGVPDFLETAYSSAPDHFVANAYSGRTGEELYRVSDPAHDREQGSAAAAIGDIDGDGVTDVIVGDGQADGAMGVAWVLSGKSGAILRTYVGTAGQRLGRWVSGLGDISGDGVPDYQIDSEVYSGATGASLFHASGPAVGLGQLDGEGGLDIAMIDSQGFHLFDWQAGEVLGSYEDVAIPRLGSLMMAAIGDVDGDGTIDLAIAGTLGQEPVSPLYVFRNLRGAPHEAAIDFLPKSCPNVLSGNGGGPLELAILGDAGADVSRIDVSTIRLAGIAPSSTSTKLRDVGTSAVVSDCACPPAAGDGIVDLVLRFDAGDLRAALGTQAPGEVRSLPFSARSDDGLAWSGSDCATASGRGNHATIATDHAVAAAGLRCTGSNVIAPGGAVSLSYPAPAGGEAMHVQVFDLAGRRIAELPEGATVDGVRTVRWDGRDAQGAQAARGVYFVQARDRGTSAKSVMVVVR